MPPPPTPSKAQRLLDLLAFLSSRRFPVGVEEILAGVPGYRTDPRDPDPVAQGAEGRDGAAEPGTRAASVRRKFERDKAELRDAGIHIETVPTRVHGGPVEDRYRLRPSDFHLPVLRLLRREGEAETSGGQGLPGSPNELRVEPGELRLALEGLSRVVDLPAFPFRREARAAIRKLTFDLAPDDLPLAPPILHLDPNDPERLHEAMGILSDALLRRKQLTFRYYGIARDARDERRVHPYGLLYQGSRWYLAAWDLERDASRLFRVDRMEDVEVNPSAPRTPDYELPAGHSLSPLRERQAWEFGETEEPAETVHVRFHPPLHRLASRNGWGEPLPEGDAPAEVRRFRVRRRGPFLRWLLTRNGEVRIEDPPDVAEALEALRLRTIEAHR